MWPAFYRIAGVIALIIFGLGYWQAVPAGFKLLAPLRICPLRYNLNKHLRTTMAKGCINTSKYRPTLVTNLKEAGQNKSCIGFTDHGAK